MSTVAVKEKPILFSGPMVRAILDGRKTQTRRIIKPQPTDYTPPPNVHTPKHDRAYFDAYCNAEKTESNPRGMSEYWCWWTPDNRQGPDWIRCPYGKPGDCLWVRESWNVSGLGFGMKPRQAALIAAKSAWRYEADDTTGWQHGWKPSIHMPRKACRIVIELADIRVQRLQDISEQDAIAEGAQCAGFPAALTNYGAFGRLWEKINGEGSWNANPFVWALTFKRVENQST